MSSNFLEYILEANNQKYQVCVHTISNNLKFCEESNASGIQSLNVQLKDFKCKVASDISNCKINMGNKVSYVIDVKLKTLSYKLCDLIENEESDLSEKAEKLGESCASTLSGCILAIIQQHLKDLQSIL